MKSIRISMELCIFTVLIMCISLVWINMAGAAPGGLPKCQSDLSTCNNDLATCQACGNGVLDPGEECDIGQLNGETCASVTMGSLTEGTLTCAPGCTFDTSACLAHFVDNGNGTITDNRTGLIWEKKDSADGVQDLSNPHDVDNLYSWSSTGIGPDGTAFTSFLATLNDGVAGAGGCTSSDALTVSGGFTGHCDWRLPQTDELLTILDQEVPECGNDPIACINPIFGPTYLAAYWTSTTQANNPDRAWFISFGGGTGNTVKTGHIFVRAVRGGR